MDITKDIVYIGVDDNAIDLFEGQYDVPNGMCYNSYVILDEKIAVLDTVDKSFTDEWLEKLDKALCGRKPDYLIVHHMEPDHSGALKEAMAKYPEMKIVSSAGAFPMMKAFCKSDYADRKVLVKEGDELSLGAHKLSFIAAPMVHWPEVIFSYDHTDKVLFSADAFGKFGTIGTDEEWACEAARYYFGIVGKFGMQVQNVLKKAAALDIKTICPLHGPVLTGDLSEYFTLYDMWSKYEPDKNGVAIFYTSVYGHTGRAAELLKDELEAMGCKAALNDLARCDMAEAVEDAFRYGRIVLATTTYNGDIFPFMKTFINTLTEHNFCNRKVGLIENGAWAPVAANVMKKMLEGAKGIEYTENCVKIKGDLTQENIDQIKALAKEMA
ncbi:MAG: FprA family A-type flavoprotein [Lachnospiraceae bacterium]|nr:FprA family A-type flavoprotein [Lachnospiraceae bacterium]